MTADLAMVVKAIAALIAIGIVITPVLTVIAMLFMMLTPARDATIPTWCAFIAFVSWFLFFIALAIFDPERREVSTQILMLTLPAIYTTGQIARVIHSLVKRGRMPRFGEWFDN